MIRRVAAQTRAELLVTVRRGESLLVTLAVPLGALLLFSVVDVLPGGGDLQRLVPGTMALAVLATAMVSSGIATGFERQAGVLRRLATTPLGRGGLLSAKASAVLVVEAVQLGLLAAAGLAMGWRPHVAPAAAAAVVAGGTATFAGLGFVAAGLLRAEANLAVTNGLFLYLLAAGGLVVPASRLPGPLQALAAALPAQPFAELLSAAFGGPPPPASAAAVLAAWGVGAWVAAALTFRWEE